MNKININGKTYNAPDGCSVSVKNGEVYIDGKLIDDIPSRTYIEITVIGDCKEVTTDAGNINIKGNVEGNVSNDAGNIYIEGDVSGNVTIDTGNIIANHISGNVSTDCGNIGHNNFFSKIIQKYL